MTTWMINCKEYSKLVSKELDQPLSLWDKVSVKIHSWVCPACHNVKKQMETLRMVCRFTPGEDAPVPDDCNSLPDEACLRIKAALKNVQDKNKT
jgi:predicted anti-sigma-YlaC factor YlaD